MIPELRDLQSSAIDFVNYGLFVQRQYGTLTVDGGGRELLYCIDCSFDGFWLCKFMFNN